jgi:uncharacterized protein with GYD domain
MPTYVTLMKLTDQGAKTIKEAPTRLQAGINAWESMGGKVLGVYASMDEYDYITIGEAPNDEIMLTFRMAISALGTVRMETMRVFPLAEFAAIVQKLP